PHNNLNPKARESLAEIRRLIAAGEYAAAEALAAKTITSQGAHGMPYQTTGSLHVEFPQHEKFDNYYRDLDIGTALASTRYQVGEVIYIREVFSSFVDQVIVVKLSDSKPRQLNFSTYLSHPAQMNFSAETSNRIL